MKMRLFANLVSTLVLSMPNRVALSRCALALALMSSPAKAGVTVTQNISPGATNWPGVPLISTVTNPASTSVGESFNGADGNTNLSETFTVVSTNWLLQTIDLYAGGGTGTGAGSNLTLNLYDLGPQTAPNPSNYTAAISGGNLFGSGAGLPISYYGQANGILELDFTGADQVLLRAGHMYAFELTGTSNSIVLFWQRVISDTYASGAAYRNQSWINGNNARDFAMAVYSLVDTNLPVITQQPQSLTVTQDQSATFTVVATGAPPLSYQWYFMPAEQTTFMVLVGQTNSAIFLTNVQLTNLGYYQIRISNAGGEVSSSVAEMTTTAPGSCGFQNDSFEADIWAPGWPFYHSTITGWTYNPNGGSGGGIHQDADQHNFSWPADGNQYVVLDGFGSAGYLGHANISQKVSGFIVGKRYQLSFWIASERHYADSQISVTLTGGNPTGPTIRIAPHATGNQLWFDYWERRTLDFSASASDVVFTFQHVNEIPHIASAVGLDKVCVTRRLIVSPDVTICPNGSAILVADGADDSASDSWSPPTGLNTTSGATVTASPSVTTTYTVTGIINGLPQTAQVTVTIGDKVAPTIKCPLNIYGYPKIYNLLVDRNCETLVPRIKPDVSDYCSPPGVTNQTPPWKTKFTGTGTRPITVTTTDSAGHSASCSVKVLIKDLWRPTLSSPTNITVTACPAYVPQLAVSVRDNCPGVVTTQVPPAGTALGPGEHYIVVTAKDAAGNISTCYTKFTVVSPGPQPLAYSRSTGLLNVGEQDFSYTARPLPNGVTRWPTVMDPPSSAPPGEDWLLNGANSKWISGQTPYQPSYWEYSTSFPLVMPGRIELNGQWAADDSGEILLNGQPTGYIIDYFGADAWHPFSIVGTDCTTNETVSFLVRNGLDGGGTDESPTGLRVEFFTNYTECCTSCIPPVILVQPQDQNGVYGSTTPVTFSVLGAGTPELSYQWYAQKIGFGGNPFLSIPGANSSTLKITPPPAPAPMTVSYDLYAYKVVVSNACGSVTSFVARAHWDYYVDPYVVISGDPHPVIWHWKITDIGCPLCPHIGSPIQPFGLTQGPEFGWTTDFGIPDINGRPVYVMKFPQTAPDAGFRISHGMGANGGGSRVNQYTLIMDVLFPASSSGMVRALLQSNPDDTDDADFFIGANNGLGVDGQFDGEVPADTWKRLALVVDLAAVPPTVSKFIDGVNVGDQVLSEGLDGRWSLNPTNSPQPYVLLFTDDNGETQEGYVSAIQFRSDVLSDIEVASLGFASSEGIPLYPQFVVEPVLSISLDQNTALLSWFGDGFQLQEAGDLTAPINWIDSTLVAGVQRVGDQNRYVASANLQNLRRFYRLVTVP